MIDTSFYSKLVSLAPGVIVAQNVIPQGTPDLRVWFQRASQVEELDLAGESLGIVETHYNIEIAGIDITQAEALADTIKAGLHGFDGMMGDTRVLECEVSDQSADYITKSFDSDEGYNVSSLDVFCIHYP